MKDMPKSIGELGLFLKQGIWEVTLDDLPWAQRKIVASLRLLAITGRKYGADECALRSSALT
jgi:hypothetical protein